MDENEWDVTIKDARVVREDEYGSINWLAEKDQFADEETTFHQQIDPSLECSLHRIIFDSATHHPLAVLDRCKQRRQYPQFPTCAGCRRWCLHWKDALLNIGLSIPSSMNIRAVLWLRAPKDLVLAVLHDQDYQEVQSFKDYDSYEAYVKERTINEKIWKNMDDKSNDPIEFTQSNF